MARLFERLRLRHKLAAILLLAALLPVASASTLALRLVLSGLETGVRDETARTLRVALNLVLGQVRDVFEGATRVAELHELADLLHTQPSGVDELLARRTAQLGPGLVEVADLEGKIVARRAVGGDSLATLALGDGAVVVRRALAWERHVDLERVGARLVVRSASPVVDASYRLRGAVVVTVPLDDEFADRLKAELSADVVVYAGADPSASSFVASDGRRHVGFAAPAAARDATTRRESAVTEVSADGRAYAVGFAPLVNVAGTPLGMLAVTLDEDNVVRARADAWRTLALGGALAVLFALVLAAFLGRGLTRPLSHLVAGARSVGRGELDTPFSRETGDEIGDLAEAFAQMASSVRANRDELAARMREIQSLNRVGRAITSVLGLDDVLRKIVDEVALALEARRTAVLLADADGRLRVRAGAGIESNFELALLGEELAWRGGPVVKVDDIGAEVDLRDAARHAGVLGAVLAVPLEQKDRVLGLLLVNRPPQANGAPPRAFTKEDMSLVATMADNVATAIQNGRLYDEVQKSSEELEVKVEERTYDLLVSNQELERTLSELGRAQSQLLLSERMAGLGALVAGIAHEINSPAGAIQGAVDTMGENVKLLARHARALGDLGMSVAQRAAFFGLLEELSPQLASARIDSPSRVRKQSRELAARLESLGVSGAGDVARVLVEIGAADATDRFVAIGVPLGTLVGYLEQYANLHRNTHAIRTAIRRVTRIVGALKSYSHLDQAKITVSDVHEGIEDTLVILDHELKHGITLTRDYAALPQVPLYVDELNQVWTNLIHNAVQALGGRGEIVIATRLDGDAVTVSIADNGAGIPPEILARIFDPFFTTKVKGEGTGLGLGIVKQIVDKHGGRIDVTSRPGETRFTVRLPVAGPVVTDGEATSAPA